MSNEGHVITAAMMASAALHPLSIQFFHISTPPTSPVFISPTLLKHVYGVIADLSISLAPVKRLFIILQFGRVQIFSLGYSLKQRAYYCWTALATVLLDPAEAIVTTPGFRCQAVTGDVWWGLRGWIPERGCDSQTNTLTHSYCWLWPSVELSNSQFECTMGGSGAWAAPNLHAARLYNSLNRVTDHIPSVILFGNPSFWLLLLFQRCGKESGFFFGGGGVHLH